MKALNTTLAGIRRDAADRLPAGQARRVSNYCDRISVWMKRAGTPSDQPKDKAISAKDAIFNALCSGQHISQLDSKRFQIEDIRTPVSHLGKRIDAAGLKLCKKRITSPVTGAWLHEYWCEPKDIQTI